MGSSSSFSVTKDTTFLPYFLLTKNDYNASFAKMQQIKLQLLQWMTFSSYHGSAQHHFQCRKLVVIQYMVIYLEAMVFSSQWCGAAALLKCSLPFFHFSLFLPPPEDLDTQTNRWGMEADLRDTTQFVTSTYLDTQTKLWGMETDLRTTAQF
jgi:hypothetical protein